MQYECQHKSPMHYQHPRIWISVYWTMVENLKFQTLVETNEYDNFCQNVYLTKKIDQDRLHHTIARR